MICPASHEHTLKALEEAEGISVFDIVIEEEEPNMPWKHVKPEPGSV